MALAPAFVGLGSTANGLVHPVHVASPPNSGKSCSNFIAPAEAPRHTVTVLAPLVALAVGSSRKHKRSVAYGRSPRVARYGGSNSSEPTLTASVWDLLDVKPSAEKEDLRAAYKYFMKTNHPDVAGERADPNFAEKFGKITELYREAMAMTDDQLFVMAFDAGVNQVVTGRINSPSLNRRERWYRDWARENGMIGGAYDDMMDGALIADDKKVIGFFDGESSLDNDDTVVERIDLSDVEAPRQMDPTFDQEIVESPYDRANRADSERMRIAYEINQRPENKMMFQIGTVVVGGAFVTEVVTVAQGLFKIVQV